MREIKFIDKELKEHHKIGLSDKKIAKIFKCSLSSVNKRRYKLGLIANFTNYQGKRNTKKECLNNATKMREKRKELIKKQSTTEEFIEKERVRGIKRRKTKEYQEYQRNYRLRNKIVKGMLSAIEDVQNGRYTVLESSPKENQNE